jgi:hypothetical protein
MTMNIPTLVWSILGLMVASAATCQAETKPEPYPTMAPVSQYMMANDVEVALARTAAPKSISAQAEVMVLGPHGYSTAEKGTNGFVCLVERSWGASTTDPVFWNPKGRAPICFNPAAARSVVPIYLMKTRLVLEGKSKADIVQKIAAAFAGKQLPALEPNAMCYMMSKQQYLSDDGKNWHPHLMFFVPGDAAKTWGAGLPGSPVMVANDPEERANIFMIWVGNWSDGTPAPATMH